MSSSQYAPTKESTTQRLSRLTSANKGALGARLEMLSKMLKEDNDKILNFIGDTDTFKDVPMGDTVLPVDTESAKSAEHSHVSVPQEGTPLGYASFPDDD